MEIPWAAIRNLLLFFAPLLLPKATGWYRSMRVSTAGGPKIRPAPPRVVRALTLLAATVLLYLIMSTPPFAAENVFVRTLSRLQIPIEVLFTRLAPLRPGQVLTEMDTKLRAKFVNVESRCLYLRYGPDVLADCQFCRSDEPGSYLQYALPDLLAPHLGNLVLLSAATSGLLTGKEGRRWRTAAVLGAVLLAAVDVYMVGTYDHTANARALRLQDLDMFFWRMRSVRLLGLAGLNTAVALLLYLGSTNRAFATKATPAARVEAVTRQLQLVRSKMNAMGIMKNSAIRDKELRLCAEKYWQREGRVMGEVMEEREVIEGMQDALQNRLDIQTITRDAETYAVNVLPRRHESPFEANPAF